MSLCFVVVVLGIALICMLERLPYNFDTVEPDNRFVAIVIAVISFYLVFTSEGQYAQGH